MSAVSLSDRDLFVIFLREQMIGSESLHPLNGHYLLRESDTMATTKKPSELIPALTLEEERTALSADFPMEISDFATGSIRVASKVPDTVADLLEELRDAHGREITVKNGQTVPAGQPKYKVATFDTEELAKEFKKHALSYSKGVMTADGYSVRLSHISPTAVRVGVGTINPKPRKAKHTESAEGAESQV